MLEPSTDDVPLLEHKTLAQHARPFLLSASRQTFLSCRFASLCVVALRLKSSAARHHWVALALTRPPDGHRQVLVLS